jgi:hypothetical protein
MAAYRTASRKFPGLHMPLLGMGCEYARMNNGPLAEQLLLSAHRMCPQVTVHPLEHGPQLRTPSSDTVVVEGIALFFNFMRMKPGIVQLDNSDHVSSLSATALDLLSCGTSGSAALQ